MNVITMFFSSKPVSVNANIMSSVTGNAIVSKLPILAICFTLSFVNTTSFVITKVFKFLHLSAKAFRPSTDTLERLSRSMDSKLGLTVDIPESVNKI